MNTQAISSVYAANNNKENGNTLQASEWNDISAAVNVAHTKINSLITDVAGIDTTGITPGASVVSVTEDTNATDATVNVAVASGVTAIGTPNVIQLTSKKKGVNTTIVSGNNINIEPRESVDTTKGGNISFKPGDDIEFCSHHRLTDNQDEVSVKVIDGDDNPVKLQLNAASMTLTTKDKTGDDANVFDVNVNSGKNTKGYLKVRAQAIDLRCEDHGGIALQPKGEDGQGHMNKIKFEHGGGDGLEFGTFNTEKTSLYTDEYRFKKDGVWKMATRTTVASDKADANDPTTSYKYVKQTDDFYDQIDASDETCTTEQIIKVAKFFASTGLETYTVAGITMPFYYDVLPITVADLNDDTDIVNENWDGPIETGYRVSGIKMRLYDLLDTMPTQNDTDNFVDNINNGAYMIVGIDAQHVYKIRKSYNVTSQDIFKLVSYMKENSQGPWANQL